MYVDCTVYIRVKLSADVTITNKYVNVSNTSNRSACLKQTHRLSHEQHQSNQDYDQVNVAVAILKIYGIHKFSHVRALIEEKFLLEIYRLP